MVTAHSRITCSAIDRTHPIFSDSHKMTRPSGLCGYPGGGRAKGEGNDASTVDKDNTMEESPVGKKKKNNERDHLMSWKPGFFSCIQSNPA